MSIYTVRGLVIADIYEKETLYFYKRFYDFPNDTIQPPFSVTDHQSLIDTVINTARTSSSDEYELLDHEEFLFIYKKIGKLLITLVLPNTENEVFHIEVLKTIIDSLISSELTYDGMLCSEGLLPQADKLLMILDAIIHRGVVLTLEPVNIEQLTSAADQSISNALNSAKLLYSSLWS